MRKAADGTSWWPRVDFFPHPAAVRVADVRGATVVVCDVLRATTTMIAALAAGCPRILPCATLASARRTAAQLRADGEPCYLAGERGGLAVRGFDLGNSPLAFLNLPPKKVVLTTSNGTRALAAAAPARRVFILSLLNLSSVCSRLASRPEKHLVLLAAGDQGRTSPEDTAVLGKLLAGLRKRSPDPQAWEKTWSREASAAYRSARGINNWTRFLVSTPHGKKISKLGFAMDVRFAGRVDSNRIVGCRSGLGIIQCK
ncbi:MAG: 2-phosphosulfolactate phosphatase [candidate division FCPU426 bacterium]